MKRRIVLNAAAPAWRAIVIVIDVVDSDEACPLFKKVARDVNPMKPAAPVVSIGEPLSTRAFLLETALSGVLER